MKKAILVFISILIFGCSIQITPEGRKVRLVSEEERNNCKFLDVVTGSMSMGASTGHDAESAMNEARNRVAALGGNGLKVINTDSDAVATTVTGEALECTFKNP